MNKDKIDKKLLYEIYVLSQQKKLPCFVFGRNFDRTKKALNDAGIHIENEYLFINAFLCKASQKEIFLLSAVDAVEQICSLSIASTMMFVSKQILGLENQNYFGEGVGVAFIDTGINPHCDFLIGRARVKFFKDFINGKKNFYDDNGHGTFVGGVCCGNGALSNFKYSGVAPKSDIFSLKALDQNGEASANKILDAMEWIFDNHKKMGVQVVCMSFGSEPLGHNDPIMLGAEALWKDGVVVVAAAGNSGPEFQTIKSPGISSKIITVGGIDDNRSNNFYNREKFSMADFSSRGPAFRNIKPEVVAPSVDIISCGTNKFYTYLSGTSVATPMIAGIAALLLERYKDASPNDVKNMILRSCQPLGFDKNFEGYGLPNIAF